MGKEDMEATNTNPHTSSTTLLNVVSQELEGNERDFDMEEIFSRNKTTCYCGKGSCKRDISIGS
jgi:hypothetical protein